MFLRSAFVALLTVGMVGSSCNSSTEKSKESVSTEVQASDEFALMEKKLESDSLNAELRTMLAVRYYSAGKLENAAFHFLEVYRQNPKNLSALTNLGNIYYDSQQDDKAIEFYEKALVLDPQNINIKCDLATCYSNVNKFKRAVDLLKENTKQDPRHVKSHYNLSIILKKSGDVKGAEEELKIYKSLAAEASQ